MSMTALTQQAQALIPAMLSHHSDWSYCGSVAGYVMHRLRNSGYSDAWVPTTNGHMFVLVNKNQTIVDLWEPDGSLKVKVFPVTIAQVDPDYYWRQPEG